MRVSGDSQFSISAFLYLILAVLLFMRLRVAREQQRWEHEDVPHPRFIALSAFNVTFSGDVRATRRGMGVAGRDKSPAANAGW